MTIQSVQIMAIWIIWGELKNSKICLLSVYHCANRELGVVFESTKCFWRFRDSWSEWIESRGVSWGGSGICFRPPGLPREVSRGHQTPCLLNKCPLCPPSLKLHSHMLNTGLVKTHDSCREQGEVLMFHWSRSGVVMLWLYNDWVFILGQAVPLISHCHW